MWGGECDHHSSLCLKMLHVEMKGLCILLVLGAEPESEWANIRGRLWSQKEISVIWTCSWLDETNNFKNIDDRFLSLCLTCASLTLLSWVLVNLIKLAVNPLSI